MPGPGDRQSISLSLEGSIGESLKQAVQGAKQLIAELHAEAGSVSVSGRFGGGGGPSGSAPGGYGGRVRVSSTVARSVVPNSISPGAPPSSAMVSPLASPFGGGAWTPAGSTVDRTSRYTWSDKHGIKDWREQYVSDNRFSSMSNFEEWMGNAGKANPTWFRFGRGAMAAVGIGGSAILGAETNSAMTGHPDRMGRSAGWAELAGGLIGAGIGSLFANPISPIIGASAGAALGGGISRFVNADQESTIRASLGLLGAGRIRAGMMGDYGMYSTPGFDNSGAMGVHAGRDLSGRIPASIVHAKGLADWIGQKRIASSGMGERGSGLLGELQMMYGPAYEDFLPNKEALASAYSSISSGLLEGGIDPTMGFGTESTYGTERYISGYKRIPGKVTYSPFNAGAGRRFRGAIGSGGNGAGGLVSNLVDVTGMAISNWPVKSQAPDTYEPEYGERQVITGTKSSELAKWLTKNLAVQTGISVDDAGKTLNPMLGAIYGMGGSVKDIGIKPGAGVNAADLLSKFGVERASMYMTAWTPAGEVPAITPQMFRQTQQDVLGSRYQQEKAGLQIRSSATSQIAPIQEEMSAWARLPGGSGSLEYAKGRKRLQSAVLGSYEEDDLGGYSLDEMRFEQRGRRMDILPFSPGNRYAHALEGVTRNRRRIGQLRQREDYLKSTGMLDERTQFSLESQIEDMTTSSYAQIATIVDGAANRIPALSANGISGTSRFDSFQLAALNLNNMGHPGGRYGAVSGSQARRTDRFYETMMGGPMPPAFGSPANSPLGSNNADTQAIVKLLERLVNATERGGGVSPQKPQRGPGELPPTGSRPIPGT